VALVEFLRERWKIFVWCPVDVPGIPRKLIEHALNINPGARQVKQSLRFFVEPKCKALTKEFHRLLEAKFIREINQSTWVANSVPVPNKK
jgi:hypothetical protein